MSSLSGKHITLAVTGGIAAYKACELVRLLVKAGADVTCAMTPAATEFVQPLTFETLTGKPVFVNQFDGNMPHLALTRQSTDLLLVAPATANTIAKVAHGFADNLVTSLICGRNCPLAVIPAMNDRMWTNPATQENIAKLKSWGVHILGPAVGDLACHVNAAGRMIEPCEIVDYVSAIVSDKILEGRKVVVTAGPTYEALDPVRGLTNKSSGKQGYAVAKAAFEAGAEVVLISGPTALKAPTGVKILYVESAMEMLKAVQNEVKDADVFIGVAAVADYRSQTVAEHKIKKTDSNTVPSFAFVQNPDILATVAKDYPNVFCVGFAAETQNLVPAAQEKLIKKGVEMIVGNMATDTFGKDTNSAVFVTRTGVREVSLCTKDELAQKLIQTVAANIRE